MKTPMTTSETAATGITGGLAAAPIVSVKPIALPAPERGEDLHVRVSAPITGHDLPIILFAHGFGSNLDGYAPLTDYWAAHGFAVIQPTHLDSRRLNLAADDPRKPQTWRIRVADMKRVLDDLDVLEAAVPGLAGRLDRDRIAAAGHSFGGHTAAILLGLRVTDPQTGATDDLSDPRVTAGVLLATAGRGGDHLTPYAAENLPWLRKVDFSHLTTPALVVAGDKDHLPVTPADRNGPPSPTPSAPATRACSPSTAASTSSAASPATTPPRPPTRTPNASPSSNRSPSPTCATPSASTAPPGPRLRRPSPAPPTRWDDSKPSEAP
jgi:hypothetical protein